MYEINYPQMPLRLGSALRVPSYAYRNWGVCGDEAELRGLSEAAYRDEWEGGSPKQVQYVSSAITRAGYGDFPQLLRDANAKAIAGLVKKFDGSVVIADMGAGESTVAIFDSLDPNDRDRVHFTLVEPSLKRVTAAAKKLRARGCIDYDIANAADLEAFSYPYSIKPQIISYVATLHHHAFYDTPLQFACAALPKDGVLTVADWHNSMWEHPNRVYRFLQTLEWNMKERDLRTFVQQFPNAADETPFTDYPAEAEAMRQIQHFWGAWAAVRKEAVERGEFDPHDDILMLEGHRPFASQNHEMARAGFVLKEKRRLLDNSGLLMLGLYEKADTAAIKNTFL